MFVPGVNGSVIPSALSGSRLKSAYKNSKKRKMPNGGSVSVDNVSSEGRKKDHDDDKEMVDGVAAILRGVKSKSNRLQLANKMAKQFTREKVNYNLQSFLKKSNVKK